MQKLRQHDKMTACCNFRVVEDDLKLFCDVYTTSSLCRDRQLAQPSQCCNESSKYCRWRQKGIQDGHVTWPCDDIYSYAYHRMHTICYSMWYAANQVVLASA